MNYAVQHITLDIEKAGSQAYVVCRKGDTARSVAIHLTQGGKPYPVAAGITWVWCGGTNISGTKFLNACTVENGIAYYNLSGNNTSMAGQFEIAVYVADREMEEDRILHLEAPVFTVVVAKSNIDTEAPQDTDEWTALEQMLATGLAEVSAEVDQSIGEANVTVTAETLEKSGKHVHFAFTGLKGETGEQGKDGADGKDGKQGEKGKDGVSPTVYVTPTTAGVTITIEDASSKTTAELLNGKDGADGKDGATPTIGDNGNWYLDTTDTGKPSRGEKGETGDSGVYVGTTAPAAGIKVWVNPDGEDISVITDAQIDALFE